MAKPSSHLMPRMLLPRSSFLGGGSASSSLSATTTKRRRHFWFFVFRILPVASVFACVACAQYSSTKWRSTQLELDRATRACRERLEALTSGARAETKTRQRIESLEKERDAQRSRLKEKNAEINQLKEELKKSKPTASAKMAMEAKKRNEELEEEMRALKVEMNEMKRENEKEMQEFKVDSNEAYDGCSKREKKLRGELERCLGGNGGGVLGRSSSSGDRNIINEGVERRSNSDSIGKAVRASRREEADGDDAVEAAKTDETKTVEDENDDDKYEQQNQIEQQRALGDLDEEDEDTKRKHDLRVERMERLEKQRQDQAKYWAKYQAKKKAKKEREEQENAQGIEEDNGEEKIEDEDVARGEENE